MIAFALVATRVAGLFMGAPMLSRRDVPARYRVGLALAVAFALLPASALAGPPLDASGVLAALAGELLLGLAIGLTVRLTLTAFQVAGAITSIQMGIALGSSYDPESGQVLPLVATAQLGLVTLIFVILDGHHVLIRSLAASFETIPPGRAGGVEGLTPVLSNAFVAMFELAARVAAPVSGLLLLINGVIGFLNRVTPQLSIFSIGFPLTVGTGLAATALAVPGTAAAFLRALERLDLQIAALIGL